MHVITRRTLWCWRRRGRGRLPAGARGITAADVPAPKLPSRRARACGCCGRPSSSTADEPLFNANTQEIRRPDRDPGARRLSRLGRHARADRGDRQYRRRAGHRLGFGPDPHIYTDKLVELTDIAEYLGKKYGGWFQLASCYGKKWKSNDWIGLPFGGSSGPCVYRISWVKEAGFDKSRTTSTSS